MRVFRGRPQENESTYIFFKNHNEKKYNLLLITAHTLAQPSVKNKELLQTPALLSVPSRFLALITILLLVITGKLKGRGKKVILKPGNAC